MRANSCYYASQKLFISDFLLQWKWFAVQKFQKNANLICDVGYFDTNTEWHFCATSHERKTLNGVGGILKRLAIIASLQIPI